MQRQRQTQVRYCASAAGKVMYQETLPKLTVSSMDLGVRMKGVLTVAKNGPVKNPKRVIAIDATMMFGILHYVSETSRGWIEVILTARNIIASPTPKHNTRISSSSPQVDT